VGAKPVAATNNLNFGNPERPEIMAQMVETIEGMAEACEALGLPVVSGNVSLYNEHTGRPIYPTPVVGVVGVLEDAAQAVGHGFRVPGDAVLLVGGGRLAVDGSAYQKVVLGEVAGRIPPPDLVNERRLHTFLADAAERGLLRSAHDVSSGGLAVCLAESAIAGGIGVDAADAPAVFDEGEGMAVVSASPEHVAALVALSSTLPIVRIGTVGGQRVVAGATELDLAEARRLYERAIPEAMGEDAEVAG
jgi:phosphoribosylformylglycinamidine synthase